MDKDKNHSKCGCCDKKVNPYNNHLELDNKEPDQFVFVTDGDVEDGESEEDCRDKDRICAFTGEYIFTESCQVVDPPWSVSDEENLDDLQDAVQNMLNKIEEMRTKREAARCESQIRIKCQLVKLIGAASELAVKHEWEYDDAKDLFLDSLNEKYEVQG
ncbi:MAG: hypothetical protein NUW00_03585 [Candidatus Kaiserbacteria bacterium]|nr:hypothetical protein [Candidatus Kaiserbacteria bacterium]MCR4330422.1 hypothetical protein [Patescibacteria group bacterium]